MNTSNSFIAGYSLSDPGEEWEDILAAFRSLGGVADNIRMGQAKPRPGLFPANTDQPFRLFIPGNLMFRTEDISFAGGRIRIRESAAVARAEREFFEKYANALSWGGGGRQELAIIVAAFDELPSDVRALLAADFGMAAWLEGEPATRIQLQFLESRAYGVEGEDVLIPILELARHNCRGFEWSAAGGVEIAGDASGEIFVSYGLHDPFSMFQRFAIASPEPVAFSLPLTVEVGAITLAVGRSFEVVRRGNAMLPRLADSGGGLEVSFLTLGHSDYPRLPKSVFRALMQPLGVEHVDEEFDRILHANWMKFLELLGVIETYEGDLIVSLRNMAQYQLDAMSFCVGARHL